MTKYNDRRNYVSNLKHAVMNMEIGKTKYDQTMKELLSDRQVLAWILKRFVPEYQNCELEDILLSRLPHRTKRNLLCSQAVDRTVKKD